LRWQKAQDGHLFVSDVGSAPKLQVHEKRAALLHDLIGLDSQIDPTAPRALIHRRDQQRAERPKGKRSIYLSVGEKKDPLDPARSPKARRIIPRP